jgi:hypothetical protein
MTGRVHGLSLGGSRLLGDRESHIGDHISDIHFHGKSPNSVHWCISECAKNEKARGGDQ